MSEYYVPGLGEKDTDKIIRSLMQAHEKTATNEDNIATNTANIATNTADIATNTLAIATNTATLAALTGSKITASLGADVALNNTSNYFTGPSVSQGSTGTWFASGTVTLRDTAGAAGFFCKLWDGTTVIASGRTDSSAANFYTSISLSGYLTSPAGNLRISVRDASSTNGVIIFNASGDSKDSTISAYRIA